MGDKSPKNTAKQLKQKKSGPAAAAAPKKK